MGKLKKSIEIWEYKIFKKSIKKGRNCTFSRKKENISENRFQGTDCNYQSIQFTLMKKVAELITKNTRAKNQNLGNMENKTCPKTHEESFNQKLQQENFATTGHNF